MESGDDKDDGGREGWVSTAGAAARRPPQRDTRGSKKEAEGRRGQVTGMTLGKYCLWLPQVSITLRGEL